MTPLSLPTFSVVTPSYNQGKFLDKTILSITEGQYPKLEYVVIDGGSTDNSVEILKKYTERIAYWVSEKDAGQYFAINKGFDRTSGEIMAWLNSDDIYLPWTIRLVGELFARFPHVEWLTTSLPMFIDANGNAITCAKNMGYTQKGFLRGDYLLHCGWEGVAFIQQESTFWRRSLWEKVGGLDSSFNYAGDFDLWARFFQHAKLFVVDVPLGCFRRHDEQKTSAAYEQYRTEALQIFTKMGGKPPHPVVQKIRNRARAMLTPDMSQFLARKGLCQLPPRLVYDWGSASWLNTE